MSFPTPADSSTAAANTTEDTEAEAEEKSVYETLSDEAVELYDDYDMIVETYRLVRKAAVTHLFDSPKGVSNADIAALKGRSPLADHFVFYKEAKDDLKDQFRELRANDELPTEVSLPGYREWAESPNYDHETITADNAADFGINPETFNDDEDPVHLPDEYEPVTDDDGNLVVWAAESGDTVADDDVISTLQGVDRIGDKKAEAALEALKDAGFEIVHN